VTPEAAPSREVVVVVNRHARHGRRALAALHDGLRSRGLAIAAFHPAANGREARKLVKRAAKAGAPAIVVAGGDGTMTRTVDVLAHRETILGVIPAGTGNSFAQSLGIPIDDLDAALDVIAGGTVARIDLGVVNGTHFANFATVGLSSQIADRTPHRWKSLFGSLAYGLAAAVPLLRHRGFHAAIRWDEGKLALQTQDVIVANGRFFGPAAVTPEASLVDRRLALYTTANASTLGALRTYVALGMDVHVKLSDAHVVNARTITVRARPKQCINIDGAILGSTPARFSVAPRALRVFVPAGGVRRG
jgi:YegS/Rv2252/BmrU family lipid kinase